MCGCVHMCICACVCNFSSTQGHLERLWDTKDINNAWKYWWFPLETCMPYAKLLYLLNHSYGWLTTLRLFLFVLSFLICCYSCCCVFLCKHQTTPSSGKTSIVLSVFPHVCFSVTLSPSRFPSLHRSAKTSTQLQEFLMKAALDNTASPRGLLVWK